MTQIPDELWEQTTWDGSRRAQLREALKLTLRERMQSIEDMADLADRFRQMREKREASGASPTRTAAPAGNVPAVQQITPPYILPDE